jgi:hypothetical protein
MVADAWLSKRTFVDPIVSMDMHLISRMRDDADLRYISTEKPIGKRGRPRKYSDKIILNDIDSQARSENKLHFQFNASLTTINIVRVVPWLSLPKEERKAFSMSDIKTMNHNTILLQRFIDVFGITTYSIKNISKNLYITALWPLKNLTTYIICCNDDLGYGVPPACRGPPF